MERVELRVHAVHARGEGLRLRHLQLRALHDMAASLPEIWVSSVEAPLQTLAAEHPSPFGLAVDVADNYQDGACSLILKSEPAWQFRNPPTQ